MGFKKDLTPSPLPTYLIFCLRAGMVNFKDPAVIAHDFGAHTSAAMILSS